MLNMEILSTEQWQKEKPGNIYPLSYVAGLDSYHRARILLESGDNIGTHLCLEWNHDSSIMEIRMVRNNISLQLFKSSPGQYKSIVARERE